MLKATLSTDSVAFFINFAIMNTDINSIVRKDIFESIGKYAYSTIDTLQNSYFIGRHIALNNIPGDIMECGLGAGANFAAMIRGFIESNDKNRLINFWGFDSFEGIQLAGPKDTSQPGIGEIKHDVNVPAEQLLVSSGITSVSIEQVRANLSRWEIPMHKVSLVKGWIQNSLPGQIDNIERLAVLRLDMDIYDPTKFALENLWDKVSPGGFVIIDDWALDGARIAVEEFFASRKIKLKPNSVPNSTPVYFIKK